MPQQSVPATPAATVTSPTQLERAEAIWRLEREMRTLDAQMAKDCAVQLAAVDSAKVALKHAQDALANAAMENPARGRWGVAKGELETLKAQFVNSYEVGTPKTVETAQGDKVQVRGGEVVSITDHAAVARTLLEKDLWQAAGATVNANQDFLATLVGNGVLADAASVEQKFTVALIAKR
jgi:hypothetical protein